MYTLPQMDEPCEAVWQSALGCLLHLTTQGGHWVASSCSQLPPAAAAALLDACVTFHWSQELHARLVQMAVNLLYLSDHSSGQQHGAVYAQRSFGMHTQQQRQREQQQEQQKEGLKAGVDAAAAAALASPEDVSVTLDTLGGSKGGKQQQQQERQEEVDAAEPAQHNDDWQDGEAGGPAHAGVDSGAADDARSTGQHSSKWGARGSQLGDLDLPWQLHAGPVDEQQLAAFGGPAKLLQHLCQAGSVEAQRTLLVPLLQVLMPPDVPDTTQLAILQALCARPSCLAALQAAVSAGLPGWSGCVVLAVQQQLGAEGLDVPLLSCLLLRLEQLSMQRMGALAGSAAASRGSAASASAGGGSSSGSSAGSQQQQQEEAQPQQQQAQLPQLPAEVQLALQVTLQQLRGELPSRPQARPGLQAADTTVYQVRGVLRVLSQQGRLYVARHDTQQFVLQAVRHEASELQSARARAHNTVPRTTAPHDFLHGTLCLACCLLPAVCCMLFVVVNRCLQRCRALGRPCGRCAGVTTSLPRWPAGTGCSSCWQ